MPKKEGLHMLGSAVRNLVFAILVLSSQAFAQQLAIATGNSTHCIGRVEIELSATGGTETGYTWSVVSGRLPTGLSLRTDTPPWFDPDTTAGLIGVAAETGTYSFTLQVVDSESNTAIQPVLIKIVHPTIFDMGELPEAHKGQTYSYTFSSTSANPIWSANPLPPGLALNPNTGILSGTPTVASVFNFSVTDGPESGYRDFSLNVYNMWITSPRILPNATLGTPYSFSFSVAGAVGSVTWNATLPSIGLTLSPDGEITGTPTYAGPWSLSLTAADSSGQLYQAQYGINVVGTPTILPILLGGPANDLPLGFDTRIDFSLYFAALPFSWSVSGIPSGMHLITGNPDRSNMNPFGASIVGIPLVSGVHEVTTNLTDGSNPPIGVSQKFLFKVTPMAHGGDIFPSCATRGLPYEATLRTIGGTLPYTWEIVSDTLPPELTMPAGLGLNSNTGVVSGIPSENGNLCPRIKTTDIAGRSYTANYCFQIGGGTTTIEIAGGSNLGAQLNQSFSSIFSASGASSYAWSVESGSTLPPGLNLSPDGTLSGTPTEQGIFNFLIRATDADHPDNYGVKRFVMNISRLTVTSNTSFSWANVDAYFEATPTVSGNTGQVTWSLASGSLLPPGLTLNASTGAISGTPTSAGYFLFTLVMTDSGSGAWRTQSFSISIYPPGVAPPMSLGTQTMGRITYAFEERRGNPPYTFSYAPGSPEIPGVRIQTGPPWPASFSSSIKYGLLGIVTEPGVYNTTMRTTDSQNQSYDRDIMLSASPIVSPLNDPLPRAAVGIPYSYELKVAGGRDPYSWSAASWWPSNSGLSLSSNGVISGTPSTPGGQTLYASVSDADGNSRIISYNLNVLPFQIVTENILPQGMVGSHYSVIMAAEVANVSWSITSGSLPSGLSLNTSTGEISGTPTAASNSIFTVRATDPGNRQSLKTFTLAIVSATPQPLVISTPSRIETPIGDYTSTTLNASGGVPPYLWSLEPGSSLPIGLEFTNQNAIACGPCALGVAYLRGRPYPVGDHTFTIRVADSASTPNTATQTVTLHVALVSIEYGNLPITNTWLIQGHLYTQAMLGIGGTSLYNWTAEGSMPPGLYLDPDGIIRGVPANSGSFSVPIMLADSEGASILRTVNFNIASDPAATLTIDTGWDLGIANQGSLFNKDITASGSTESSPGYVFSALTSLPSGCSLTTSSGTGKLSCGIGATGTYNFTLRVEDVVHKFGVKTFTLRIATPNTILTANNGLNNAGTGASFSQKIIVLGPGGTWTLTSGSLPPGITLDSDGTLHGAPTTSGNYTFTLVLTDALGRTISRTFNLKVAGLIIVDPMIIPVHAIGNEPFTYTFTAQGGGESKVWSAPYSFLLPSGMSLSSNGVLSGTPTFTGNSSFYITVSDGTTSFTKPFSLVVRGKYPLLSSGLNRTLDDTTVGQVYQFTLPDSGGIPPYTWSVAPGSSLPPGLNFVSGADLTVPSTGSIIAPIATLLAGVPTVAGSYTFTLLLTDATGVSARRTITLNVSPLRLSQNGFSSSAGSSFDKTLAAYGGSAPYSYTLASGSLPLGLALSPDGRISGTVEEPGNYSFAVRITDSAGDSARRGCTMSISTSPANQLTVGTMAPSSFSVGSSTFILLSGNGGTSPYTFSLESGTLPPNIVLANDPALGWALIGHNSTAGPFTYRLKVVDGAGKIGYKTFTQQVSPVQMISSPSTGSVVAGQPVNIQLAAFGGTPPYSFEWAGDGYFPIGLTLNPDGSITGSTNEIGNFNFTIVATDQGGNPARSGRSLQIFPAELPLPLAVSSFSIDDNSFLALTASVNSDVLMRASTVSGVPPYSYSLVSGELPPGLTMVNNAGSSRIYITGVPSSVGSFSYILRVDDSAGQNINLHLATPVSPLSLAPNLLAPATVGMPYSVTLMPAGYTPPYSLQPSFFMPMPPGLAFNGTTIYGTPTVPGIYTVIFVLRDNSGNELNKLYALYVESAAMPIKLLRTSPANVQTTVISDSTPAPVPINIESGVASVGFTAAVAGIPGASLSVASGTTPQAINLLIPSGLAVGNHYGVIEITSPQAINTLLSVRVAINVIPPPPCSYTVSPSSTAIAAGGGSGNLNVSTASYCSWTAAASDNWIAITSSASGSGDGTVSYSLSSNPGTSPRNGFITVNGQTHSITQFGSSCAFTIDPANANVFASGGAGNIAVNASLAECPWIASSNDPSWIEIVSGSSGTGNGVAMIKVLANSGTASRSGSATVAGLSYTVDQAGADCIVSLASGGADFSAGGGTGSVNVTTNGCSYNTVEGPSWITVTSGGSGSGSGTLNYSVAPNSTTQGRSGRLLIGAQPFLIAQAGTSCSFTVNAGATSFGSSAGSGTISIAANGANCGWMSSTGSDFLKITSGWFGRGSGTVAFSLAANAASHSRAGSIVVAGQTVTIDQAGANCGYNLRSSDGILPSIGGMGSAGVIAPAGCNWTASSNESWLSLNSSSGSGASEIYYIAQSNSSTAARTATINVEGQAYTVNQLGVPCSYTLSSSSASIGPGQETGSFAFSTSRTGCSATAVSYSNWIAVSTESATVTFTVDPNPSAFTRSGNIQVGDRTFKVTQTGAFCFFSLNAYGAIFNNTGGIGDVLATSPASSCVPAVEASPELAMGLLTHDETSQIWTQPYGVPSFESFNPWTRMLQIRIGGRIFTVKQTSW
jgi:large repetitive protein